MYKLDLLERDVPESLSRLRRYLHYEAVKSGQAIDDARRDYRDISKNREIKRHLPEAWAKLVKEQDEALVELLASRVENICGFRPEPDVVAEFFEQLGPLGVAHEGVPKEIVRPRLEVGKFNTNPTTSWSQLSTKARLGFELHGKWFDARSGRDVLIQVFQQLTSGDPSFPERFSLRTSRGTSRPYLARSRAALFPRNQQLAMSTSHSRELFPDSGWWVDLNHSRSSIERIIAIACEVAGITYGDELKVSL